MRLGKAKWNRLETFLESYEIVEIKNKDTKAVY